MADIDFGDMLDYLAIDPAIRAVLLYVGGTTHARKFMSAARDAARAKPVVVVKAAESGKAARSYTGALAGSDAGMRLHFAAPAYCASTRRPSCSMLSRHWR